MSSEEQRPALTPEEEARLHEITGDLLDALEQRIVGDRAADQIGEKNLAWQLEDQLLQRVEDEAGLNGRLVREELAILVEEALKAREERRGARGKTDVPPSPPADDDQV